MSYKLFDSRQPPPQGQNQIQQHENHDGQGRPPLLVEGVGSKQDEPVHLSYDSPPRAYAADRAAGLRLVVGKAPDRIQEGPLIQTPQTPHGEVKERQCHSRRHWR